MPLVILLSLILLLLPVAQIFAVSNLSYCCVFCFFWFQCVFVWVIYLCDLLVHLSLLPFLLLIIPYFAGMYIFFVPLMFLMFSHFLLQFIFPLFQSLIHSLFKFSVWLFSFWILYFLFIQKTIHTYSYINCGIILHCWLQTMMAKISFSLVHKITPLFWTHTHTV